MAEIGDRSRGSGAQPLANNARTATRHIRRIAANLVSSCATPGHAKAKAINDGTIRRAKPRIGQTRVASGVEPFAAERHNLEGAKQGPNK